MMISVKMYIIKIIIMLSTIFPSTDSCSSRTFFHRKPINIYHAVQFSMETPSQNKPNDIPAPPPPSAPPPQLTTSIGIDQTTLSYQHHHLGYGKESDEDDEKLKLNRSQRSDLQNEEAELESKLEDDLTTAATDVDHSEESTISVPSDMLPVEDVHYKFMNEIVSNECVGWFRLEFCLNGGRCFLYPILNQSLSSCECAEGYVGERCEAKSFEFIPQTNPRIVLAKTIGGPLVFCLAVIDIIFLLFLFCKNCNRD